MGFLSGSSHSWSRNLDDGKNPDDVGVTDMAGFMAYNAKYQAEQKRIGTANDNRNETINVLSNTQGRQATILTNPVNAQGSAQSAVPLANNQNGLNFAKTPGFNPTSIL